MSTLSLLSRGSIDSETYQQLTSLEHDSLFSEGWAHQTTQTDPDETNTWTTDHDRLESTKYQNYHLASN
jgi:hypothetical protein